MTTSILKRIEQHAAYKRIKLSVKRLAGEELWLKPDIKIDMVYQGGWHFHPDILNSHSVIYSFGVGDNIDFDLAVISEFDLEVHAFDPTPATIEWLEKNRQIPEKFHFHPWAVTASDGIMKLYPRVRRDKKSRVMYTLLAEDGATDSAVEVPAFTVSTIASKLGHNQIDLMKVDIEGAEYDVLHNMLECSIKPRQLLVEFHHRFPGIGPKKTAGIIRRLRDAGYRLFAISETGRELSFIIN